MQVPGIEAQIPALGKRLDMIHVHARTVPGRTSAKKAGRGTAQGFVADPLPCGGLVKTFDFLPRGTSAIFDQQPSDGGKQQVKKFSQHSTRLLSFSEHAFKLFTDALKLPREFSHLGRRKPGLEPSPPVRLEVGKIVFAGEYERKLGVFD